MRLPAQDSWVRRWLRRIATGAGVAFIIVIVAAGLHLTRQQTPTEGVQRVTVGGGAVGDVTVGGEVVGEAGGGAVGEPVGGGAVGKVGGGGAVGGGEPAGAVSPGVAAGPLSRVDARWAARTAAATGIPGRALIAYASADLAVSAEDPVCGIGWNTLAGIGMIESDHGRHGGAVLREDGYPSPAIRGAALDGNGVAAIGDSDGGAWDGDSVWDRAVGPMQFIPGTWRSWGADGNGDGTADPNSIDDAALAAARYLCHSGEMTSTGGWRSAVFSYNHLDSYVNDVAAAANLYATRAGG